jgi:tetratricopeptide (TPR) repeat protein
MLWMFSRECFFVLSLACFIFSASCVSAQPAVTEQPAKTIPLGETEHQRIVDKLIANGEYTLSVDQLLTPINDNAFDFFRAALKLDPQNQRALKGLQGIAIRYVDLARESAAKSRYSEALKHLNSARMVDVSNPQIKEVAAAINEQIKKTPPPEPYRQKENEYLLESRALSKKEPQILSRLAEIAESVKSTNSLAIIVARSDTEGRWIYQQMREAVPGYKVRGDIKVGNPPRIQLVPIVE